MNSFYRHAQGRRISTLGIGTYLGPMDDATDASYRTAIATALRGGINVIDTSLNYRHQRSERAVARALVDWGGAREDVLVCTKAGFLVPDAVPAANLQPADVCRGIHSMAPAFLDDQLNRSLSNLALDSVDVFYVHNPETQLAEFDEHQFYARIHAAFEFCEHAAARGRIGYYGVATWDAFRRGEQSVSLRRLEAIARSLAGDRHKFRFVQLPVNLAMPEALTKPVEPGLNFLDLASQLNLTVIASGTLLQARLTRGLPDEVAQVLGGSSDAQRAIQFTRSTPGVTTALVGMSRAEHVTENLAIAELAPAPLHQYRRLFQ